MKPSGSDSFRCLIHGLVQIVGCEAAVGLTDEGGNNLRHGWQTISVQIKQPKEAKNHKVISDSGLNFIIWEI